MPLLESIPALPVRNIQRRVNFYRGLLESFIAGTASCRIRVEVVDGLYDVLKTRGILHPRAHLQNRAWGDRDFSVVDPDNNLVTFFERKPAS